MDEPLSYHWHIMPQGLIWHGPHILISQHSRFSLVQHRINVATPRQEAQESRSINKHAWGGEPRSKYRAFAVGAWHRVWSSQLQFADLILPTNGKRKQIIQLHVHNSHCTHWYQIRKWEGKKYTKATIKRTIPVLYRAQSTMPAETITKVYIQEYVDGQKLIRAIMMILAQCSSPAFVDDGAEERWRALRHDRPRRHARLPADIAAHVGAGVSALDLPLGDVAGLIHHLAHLHVSREHRHRPRHGRTLVGRALGAEEGDVDGPEHLVSVELCELGIYHVQRVLFLVQLPYLR